MITTLAAVLSLATALALDVPYLPQTDALCGGAAAAMVLRYWGDAHADAQSFAPLVDRDAGGIANGALTRAIESRGWHTTSAGRSLEALRTSVRDRRPVIVLLPDRGDRYHYVVVIGAIGDAIVVHDPSWGPSRSIRAADFERAWQAAGFWSLIISPPSRTQTADVVRESPPTPIATDPAVTDRRTSGCDLRLDRALADIHVQGLDRADALLAEVRAECPDAAGPLRELSAVRFAQRRWTDASALARDALRLDPRDAYALDVLGSSLFMQHDELGALGAWNQIGKPRVNVVRIEGLHHIRYQTVAAVMDLQPNMLLTAERYERARRRLNALPDRAATRLAVKPEADGFATVDVVVVELAAIPRGAIEWAGAAAKTATSRELSVSVPGVSGQGEVWSAGWRWWHQRPAVSVGLAAPRVGHLPGVWRFDGSWESESFGTPSSSVIESRVHGGVTVSDWLSGRLRYSVATGVDGWSGGRKAASIGGSLERAAFDDRVRLTIAATQWAPIAGGAAFHSIGARAATQSSTEAVGWVLRGSLGLERVSDAAPFALWPGAGEGQVRAPLLRAHPLLNDGAIDLTQAAAFGRSLAFGSGEIQRWLDRPSLVRVGVAGFADIARASRQADGGATPLQVDLGVGLRLKIPGTPGALRADVARGLRDGANALTIGWLF